MLKLDTVSLRKLQLDELELLKEVDRICRLHNIKYSLDGGTLLGAIRHKGFIPWDDDADVNFTREEFNKFRKACEESLDKERFFLMDYETDDYYRWGFSKLQLLKTDYIREGQETSKWAQRINIDLFILDNAPDNPIMRRVHYFLSYVIRKGLYSEFGRLNEKNALGRGIYKILHCIPRNTYVALVNKMADITNRKETKLLRPVLCPYSKLTNLKLCKYGVPRELFTEYEDVEFEGYKFKAFKDANLFLTYLYGEYMELPPEEKRIPHAPAVRIRFSDGTVIKQ